jgi:hypothetical protein
MATNPDEGPFILATRIVGALVVIVFILALGTCVLIKESFGHDGMTDDNGDACVMGDYGCGHSLWHKFYSTAEPPGPNRPAGGPLMRPHDPRTSCCSNDCIPVKARYVAVEDRWEAFVQRRWERVPNERIKQNVTSPNDGAHACVSRRTSEFGVEFYCFIRPEGGV